MKAVLVAIKLSDNKYFKETLDECLSLCDAANIEIINTVTQSSNSLDPNTALRKGKLDELKVLLEELDCDQVVFYNNLKTKVVSNIKDYLEADVMDRTSLILNIFSSRAKSKEAQIQTEIARLKYDMPQLLKDNMDSDKQRGGTVNNRGAGETRSVIIRRQMESRIQDLKEELKKLESRKDIEYQKRNKSDIKKVALVGYTNAGKSSLMNNLLRRNERSDKSVYEKDQLFATLDTSVRNIKYKKHEFLLFDTVGFVSDLPHDLIEAFKSTLKAANNADLLIHVIDGSNPNNKYHEITTLDTLKQIEADKIPMINVYNKCDLIDSSNNLNGLLISCKESIGIEELLDKIDLMLYPKEETKEVLIPYNKLSVLSDYKNSIETKLIENTETGSLYQITGTSEIIEKIINRL